MASTQNSAVHWMESDMDEETKTDSRPIDSSRRSAANIKVKVKAKDNLNVLNFNQNSSCIAIGHGDGFRVYSTNPLKCQFERLNMGSIAIVELLFRNNIIALVGGFDNR